MSQCSQPCCRGNDRAMSKCRSDMVLAVVTPHPVAPQLGKHTYLCAKCNQTRAYILPTDGAAEADDADRLDSGGTGSDRRRDSRESLHASATYLSQGRKLPFALHRPRHFKERRTP